MIRTHMGFHIYIFRTQLIKVFCALGALHNLSETSPFVAWRRPEYIKVVFIFINYH